MLKFSGIQKLTLVDYPGEVAATLFLSGCNFRCFYCFNPDLVFERDTGVTIPSEEAIHFLKEIRDFLDALCVTGGEPLLHFVELSQFLQEIKELGYKVKLDTNGSFPHHLRELINKGLIDYIAMDIKGPLEKYSQITECDVDLSRIRESVKIIKESGL